MNLKVLYCTTPNKRQNGTDASSVLCIDLSSSSSSAASYLLEVLLEADGVFRLIEVVDLRSEGGGERSEATTS